MGSRFCNSVVNFLNFAGTLSRDNSCCRFSTDRQDTNCIREILYTAARRTQPKPVRFANLVSWKRPVLL